MEPATISTIAYIVLGLISILTSVGMTHVEKRKVDDLHKKAKANRATSGDLAVLIDMIKTKSQALSFKKRTEIANNLSRLGSNTYISSGLSEEIMNKVKQKLTDAATQIEQLRNMGDVESTASENLLATYAAFSDEDKGKARKLDTKAWKNSKEYKELMAEYDKLDEYTDQGVSHKDEEQEKAWRKKYTAAEDAFRKWDVNTAAGQVGQQAEDHANKAQEYYKQANELGEKYA